MTDLTTRLAALAERHSCEGDDDLAALLAVNRATLWRWREDGARPTPLALRLIALLEIVSPRIVRVVMQGGRYPRSTPQS